MQVGDSMYYVTKNFPHSLGLSCVYRNHASKSHCSKLHGYSLSFSVTLQSRDLKEPEYWVYDYGEFKFVKEYLVARYDHTLLVAQDDPERPMLTTLGVYELVDLRVVPACSTEAFAFDLFTFIKHELEEQRTFGVSSSKVSVYEVSCSEHDGNKAVYRE